MLDRVEEFAGLLRKSGVRVSTAEVIDAVRALELVGVGDGAAVRGALRASLVKRSSDVDSFDQLFELYFLGGAALSGGAGASLADVLGEAGLDADAIAGLLEELARELAGMSAIARASLGAGTAEIAQLVRAARGQVDLARMRSPLQVGYFTYRVLDALGVDAALDAVRAMLDRLRASGRLDQPQHDALGAIVRRNVDEVRRQVREHINAEFRRQNLSYMEELTTRSLSDKPLSQLTDDEVDSLRAEVRRLARLLRARVSLRPVVRRRGRLDLRRTLRRALATGGIPFELVRRERERRKPRLVVLCDVSDSVRNVSRFMLMLVYALQELFDRVDSFAFVAELGELSDLFRSCDIDRALELTYAGAAVNIFANSNYGNAFREFAERYLDRVTPRTTVLVLGDGRNNYHPSHASVLADVRARAKQVWWLNPESPAAWGFGDSAMAEYEPHCDRVVVVNNLESLRAVVDQLIV